MVGNSLISKDEVNIHTMVVAHTTHEHQMRYCTDANNAVTVFAIDTNPKTSPKDKEGDPLPEIQMPEGQGKFMPQSLRLGFMNDLQKPTTFDSCIYSEGQQKCRQDWIEDFHPMIVVS